MWARPVASAAAPWISRIATVPGPTLDRGVDEDDPIRRGNAFGQFRHELMANDRAGVPDGTLARECAGGLWADPIIASQ